jgi:hypothetical protein
VPPSASQENWWPAASVGDTTQHEAAGKRNPANSDEPLAEVEARPDCLTVLVFFAGIS